MAVPGRLAIAGALALLLVAATVPALAGHGAGAVVPTLDVEYLKRLLDAGEPVVLVDLRPAEAYRKGHLPGARSLPVTELESRLGEIPRTGRVLLYGNSVIDPYHAYTILQPRGHRNVLILEDGFGAWVKRGFPLEPGR